MRAHPTLRERLARLMSFFRRDALDREFDAEAQSHMDLAVEDYVRHGTPKAEAQRRARIAFGAVEAAKDAHRDARGFPRLEGLFHDLRFAPRGLRRDRAFSLTAIATLALAIALNVTAFTVMDVMLFRGLPLAKQSDRLVYVGMRKPSTPAHLTDPVLYRDFQAWRGQARGFEGLAFSAGSAIAFRDGGRHSVDMNVQRLSANAFGLLGVRPILGRDFVASDEQPGASGHPRLPLLGEPLQQARGHRRADRSCQWSTRHHHRRDARRLRPRV